MSNNQNDPNAAWNVSPSGSASQSGKQDNTTLNRTQQPQPRGQEGGKAVMMSAAIKKAWSKLTDEDVKLYEHNHAQFFARIKEKYGVSQEEAQKQLKIIETNCGCGSGAEKAA